MTVLISLTAVTINHNNNDDGDDVGGGDHNGKYMAACKLFSPIYDVGDDDNGGVVGVGLGDHNDEKLQGAWPHLAPVRVDRAGGGDLRRPGRHQPRAQSRPGGKCKLDHWEAF